MSPKVRRRKESGLKIQEALIETHTEALSSEKDDKAIKKLKKKKIKKKLDLNCQKLLKI